MESSVCIEEHRDGLSWKRLPNVELHYDSYMNEFKTIILPLIKPNWDPSNLGCTVFEEGVTNKLVGIYEKGRGIKDPDGDVVLLRINGNGTEKFIDREGEIISFLTLNKAGLVPPFYVQLKNGLCYGFAFGRHVTLDEIRYEDMMRRICKAVAQFNLVPIPDAFKGRRPQVWNKIDEWLKILPSEFEDTEKQKCFVTTIGSIDRLKAEVEDMKSRLSDCQSPVELCHNDLLGANMIYNDKTGTITLIDYEYGGPNYVAFEIADHFCEFAGLDTVDYSRYPNEDLQKKWIRMYLEEKAYLQGADSSSMSDDKIHSIYREVNKFALAVHLFWATWGLLQAVHSVINFNYIEYAGIRFGEYLKRKDEFLAL